MMLSNIDTEVWLWYYHDMYSVIINYFYSISSMFQILQTINAQAGTASFEKKIDNISTFLLR